MADGNENLVVVSKYKAYVKSSYGLSTSGAVPGVLSDIIRKISDCATECAKKDNRKTLMDRDFQAVLDKLSSDCGSGESNSCSM